MSSGDTLLIFHPGNNEPPASNMATFHVRNNHIVLAFDGGTDESAVFKGIMPRIYSGGGVTVYIHYAMDTEAAGDIDWDAAFERIGDGELDIDGDSFAAVNSTDDTTVPGTAGLVDIVAIEFDDGEDMDSVAVGETFRLKITRDADADTATGDAHLVMIELKEG